MHCLAVLNAQTVALADLREAERALKSAEAAHEDDPRSRAERSYAYLAVRKSQLAMAKADADTARMEQLHAAQVQGAQSRLDILADNLLAHEDQVLVIRGYADARGPRRYNQTLSRERAGVVRRYLEGRGVPAERLRTEAWLSLAGRARRVTRTSGLTRFDVGRPIGRPLHQE
jgi:outer membrane protein OmpA-like peptidoglycan-associated protein